MIAEDTDYNTLFWKSYFLIKHAPIFAVVPSEDGKPCNLSIPESYHVELAPLNPLPCSMTATEWGEMIGF